MPSPRKKVVASAVPVALSFAIVTLAFAIFVVVTALLSSLLLVTVLSATLLVVTAFAVISPF
ncbi:hypothetical protein D3C72_2208210 [compost metagenome]